MPITRQEQNAARRTSRLKTSYKAAAVVLITALYVLFMLAITDARSPNTPITWSVSASPQDMKELTDEAIDTFALVYSTMILGNQDYMLTVENRQNIKNLLNAMGVDNIQKLNEATFSGNTDKIVETVQELADENFGWEEAALMAQWQ